MYSLNIHDFETLKATDNQIEAVCNELDSYDWDNIMDELHPIKNSDMFINALEKAVNNNLIAHKTHCTKSS